jgi:hypothetical protein
VAGHRAHPSGQCPFSSTTRRSRPSAGSWTLRRRTGIGSSRPDLTACVLIAKYAAQSMTKRQAGKIINIASTYSLFGSALAPSYSAAKGAIMQLTKSLPIELAPPQHSGERPSPGLDRYRSYGADQGHDALPRDPDANAGGPFRNARRMWWGRGVSRLSGGTLHNRHGAGG